ncbi:MAG: GCN5-related N-acetyltransferase [Segetibacter sp.]|nr:GCN5-related N-acetyltransferase [Segetibacter sp.]
MTIITAENQHIPVIQEIAFKTWPVTYGSILSAEQLDFMLHMFYSMSALENQFENDHKFLLAQVEEQAIGFASFSWNVERSWKLHKLYVLPDYQKTGAGKALLKAVEEEAAKDGAESLQLNVNRNNKARTFYEKKGYHVISEEDIDIGSGYFMNDYIMEKSLAPSSSPSG